MVDGFVTIVPSNNRLPNQKFAFELHPKLLLPANTFWFFRFLYMCSVIMLRTLNNTGVAVHYTNNNVSMHLTSSHAVCDINYFVKFLLLDGVQYICIKSNFIFVGFSTLSFALTNLEKYSTLILFSSTRWVPATIFILIITAIKGRQHSLAEKAINKSCFQGWLLSKFSQCRSIFAEAKPSNKNLCVIRNCWNTHCVDMLFYCFIIICIATRGACTHTLYDAYIHQYYINLICTTIALFHCAAFYNSISEQQTGPARFVYLLSAFIATLKKWVFNHSFTVFRLNL